MEEKRVFQAFLLEIEESNPVGRQHPTLELARHHNQNENVTGIGEYIVKDDNTLQWTKDHAPSPTHNAQECTEQVRTLERVNWEIKALEKEAKELGEYFISSRWYESDVLSQDDTLTHEQCVEVLDACINNHDATIGINRDVIDYHISAVTGKA